MNTYVKVKLNSWFKTDEACACKTCSSISISFFIWSKVIHSFCFLIFFFLVDTLTGTCRRSSARKQVYVVQMYFIVRSQFFFYLEILMKNITFCIYLPHNLLASKAWIPCYNGKLLYARLSKEMQRLLVLHWWHYIIVSDIQTQ